MKYKIIFGLRRFFSICLILFIILASIFMINGTIEKIYVNKEIEEFKARASGKVETILTINGQEVLVYKVPKKYDYEDITRPTFSKVEYNYYIGSKADITITSRNPLREMPNKFISSIVGFFSRNFYLGHATLNTTDDGSMYVESVGGVKEERGVNEIVSEWFDLEVRDGSDTNRIVGLRLKNTTEEMREEIVKEAKSKVGLEYNYNFFYSHPNKYYCTDLITRCVEKVGIDLNYDGMFSIGNDLILSKHTYMIFYLNRIKDGVFELYYLG